jgi:hypothetical protein
VGEDLNLEGRPYAIALGGLPSVYDRRIFGRVTNPGAGAAFVPIWSPGVAYAFPAAAVQLDLSSDSANDAALGTGARTVYVEGLDASWVLQAETVALAGVALVTTTKSYRRVRKIQVNSAGTGEVNAGTVSAVATGTADLLARIEPAEGHSLQCVVSVPLASRLLLLDPVFSWNNTAVARLRVREYGGAWQTRAYYDGLVFSGRPGQLSVPRDFPARADVVLEAMATSANISAEFLALIVASP